MIADEIDIDVNNPKECMALDTIFNHATTPGCDYLKKIEERYNNQSS